MSRLLRVGTRKSPLALAQTQLVVAALRRRDRAAEFEVVPLTTAGDRNRTVGGSPDFTDRISAAVEAGEVDLAVHSAKDLPVRPERGVRIAAFPRRAAVADVLVARPGLALRPPVSGTRIGSSSVRRRAQLLREWPGVVVQDVRGNVGTRIGLVDSGSVDAVVLAAAGLARLGLAGRIDRTLPPTRFLPAPGQGALAVEVRYADRATDRVVRTIDHGPTRAAVTAERTCAAALGADCDLPLAALARVRGETLTLDAELFDRNGRRSVRVRREGPVVNAGSIGRLAGAALERTSESPTPGDR
ncbi:MAG: hydroxymethylbilane synthase [Thermoplasmata archaeon]|nr:hydroxymethylbilane synthase [Thermoplasmata archaeon]